MPDDRNHLDLTFPSVVFGRREFPFDLRALLYAGGAAVNIRHLAGKIDAGQLGAPIADRLDLVKKIHEVLNGLLIQGGSKHTAKSQIVILRQFFAWAERSGRSLTLPDIETTFLDWSEALLHRVTVVRDLQEESAYEAALRISRILNEVLARHTPLIFQTRLTKPKRRKTVFGLQADKQNLQWTFEFGHVLSDICDSLSIDAMFASLPVRIPLRSGKQLEEWSGLRPEQNRISNLMDTRSRRGDAKVSQLTRSAYEADRTLHTRYPLANLRIEAELLMFIGQTGMNLGQAHKLQICDFFFSSDVDGYKVTDHKKRRSGQVLFEIFRAYRPHFERYLTWRRRLFPEENLLFPFVRRGRSAGTPPPFDRLRNTCKKVGMRFVPPSSLRNTRINWLLRRSGDPDLTAEMAQHRKETLLTVYETPSLQRTMGETMRFWLQNDPASGTTPVAPGQCNGSPLPAKDIPSNAPTPDCIQASGCLWCEHHRDIDSLDYVWSLACFRHLKILEVGRYNSPERNKRHHPADHAIARLSDKLRWFKESNEQRRSWVEEALLRVEEGSYHPDWIRLIEDMEGSGS